MVAKIEVFRQKLGYGNIRFHPTSVSGDREIDKMEGQRHHKESPRNQKGTLREPQSPQIGKTRRTPPPKVEKFKMVTTINSLVVRISK